MKKNFLTIVAASLLLCLSLTASAHASGVTPGSSADPLVSQSYVDDRFEELLQEYQDLLSNVTMHLTDRHLDIIVEDVIRTLENTGHSQAQGTTFTPVHMLAGQVLLGGEGTEIILRSGIATAYVFGQNGLSDVTLGSDIFGNEQVRLNHLLIVPRADGRGVRASTECWVLVKGTYTLTN
ncbi:MAG: hypothetical protein FWE91_00280 [Defluviitaleaceae bacterium]|nr:hypothetical protein [Defluviitaleaceae bacterium]MCL2836283.1 hypothetical protein [Defluviitaleaceae bacterium]